MTTAEEMIERVALAIAKKDRCIRGGGPSSLCIHECACKRQARAACAVAVEMCAEMITPPDTEGGEYFDGLRGQAARFKALATAIKGE